MTRRRSFGAWRRAYAVLPRLYPRDHRERCAEGMEQTFVAVLRERAAAGRPVIATALWLCVDACAGLLRERARRLLMHGGIVRVAFATAILLLIPFVAMWFTDEVAWSGWDFLVAGVLLFGTGLAWVLLTTRSVSLPYRLGAALALGAALLLVWINLAVGIIGAEGDPANLPFFAVIGIGVTGACVARFRPVGMARALLVTAAAQALVPAVALLRGHPSFDADPPRAIATVVILSAFFAALFAGAAWLFRRAHAGSAPSN
jgi:hypothetical protein